VSVGSEIGRIPLNPQRPSRARSTENPRRVKQVRPFVDFHSMIFHLGLRDIIDLNFLILNQGPRGMIDLNFLIFNQGPRDTKNQKISSKQKVPHILLASAFPAQQRNNSSAGTEDQAQN